MMRNSVALYPAYEVNIPFKRSRDYQLLLLVTYLGAWGLVIHSGWSWLLITLLSVSLATYGGMQFTRGRPHCDCDRLVSQQGRCRLHLQSGDVLHYSTLTLRYDTGLFMRIDLTGGGQEKSRRLYLFHDQMPLHGARHIHLLTLNRDKHVDGKQFRF